MVDHRTMRTLPKVAKRKLPGFARSMPVVAAVDAAKHAPAWALADRGELIFCGFDHHPGLGLDCPLLNPTTGDIVVLEASRSYGSKDHGKHGDILAEAIGGALCAGSMRAGEVVLIAPDEWVGTGPKPPRHQAVWEALTPDERALVAQQWKPGTWKGTLAQYIEAACDALSYGRKVKYSNPIHNILDAVGLLLFALGRIGRAGAKIKAQRERPSTTITGAPFRGRVLETTSTAPLKLNKKRFYRL